MENKLHIELLSKATDLTTDEIEADLIKSEYETPFQVISVHSALSALQALETALTEKHLAEVELLKMDIEGLKEYVQHKKK